MRTIVMSNAATEISVDGLVRDRRPLTTSVLVDLAVVDAQGGAVVRLVDVLAAIRLDANADLLITAFDDGSFCALPIRELLDDGQAFIDLGLCVVVGEDRCSGLRPTIVAPRWCDSDRMLRSIWATRFVDFVDPA